MPSSPRKRITNASGQGHISNEKLITFSNNLRACRCALNLTQAQLAIAAGVASTYIGKAERGLTNPKLDTITRIADALQTQVGVLLGEGDGV